MSDKLPTDAASAIRDRSARLIARLRSLPTAHSAAINSRFSYSVSVCQAISLVDVDPNERTRLVLDGLEAILVSSEEDTRER